MGSDTAIIKLSMIPGSAKEIPPWFLQDLLSKELLFYYRTSIEVQLRPGIPRSSPRGKILWQEYISKSYVYRGNSIKYHVEFPDLNQNDVLRSYIKWGLEE